MAPFDTRSWRLRALTAALALGITAAPASAQTAAPAEPGDAAEPDDSAKPEDTAEPPAAEPAGSEAKDGAGDDEGFGEDEDFGEDGFGEGSGADPFQAMSNDLSKLGGGSAAERPLPVHVGGFVRSQWGLWTERFDDNSFATGRQNLDLWLRYRRGDLRILAEGHLEYDVAYLYQRDTYDEPTLDAYEWLIDTREVFAELTRGAFQLVVGRQIIPLGESNLVTPVDVVSPYDTRLVALTDVDDMRLPLLATRLGYLRGSSQFDLFVIHETGFGYRSSPLGAFSQLPALGVPPSPVPLRYRDLQDRFAVDQQELMARWIRTGAGLDTTLFAGSVLDNTGVFLLDAEGAEPGDITLDHRRYGVVGMSAAKPVSSWVIKWDASVEVNRAVNVVRTPGTLDVVTDETSIVNVVLSTLYSGIQDATLSMELAKGFYLDGIDQVLLPFDAPTLGLRGSYSMRRGDLELTGTALFSGLELEYGWFLRAEVAYRFADGLKGILGYATYHPGDEFSLLSGFETHDRLFGQLRWDFVLL